MSSTGRHLTVPSETLGNSHDTSNDYAAIQNRQATKNKLYNSIRGKICRLDDLNAAFITDRDLKDVWENKSDLRTLARPWEFSSVQTSKVRKNFLKRLSIMIYCGTSDDFPKVFRAREHHGSDKHVLPYKNNELHGVLDDEEEHQFYRDQYVFLPFTITEHEEQCTDLVDGKIHLPFVEIQERAASGAYGDVARVVIAPGMIIDKNGAPNMQKQMVACKIISHNSQQVFSQEVGMLQLLKQSITSHEHIMLHLATIIHGLKYMIVLPWAEFGDLYQFLYGLDNHGKYGPGALQSSVAYKSLEVEDMQKALLLQFYGLTRALCWLHRDLCFAEGEETYCAHLDLKPDNILLRSDANSAIGKWVVSDFGISAVSKTKQKTPLSYHPSYQELTRTNATNPTVMQEPPRGSGTYQAPEVKLQSSTFVGRRSDVWSLACIFSEVLAFALGGHELVIEFHDSRAESFETGRDSATNYFFYSVPQETKIPQLRKSVSTWLADLPKTYTDRDWSWIHCSVGIIRKYLVPRDERPESSQFLSDIEHLNEHIEKHHYDRPCHFLNQNPDPRTSTSPYPASFAGSLENLFSVTHSQSYSLLNPDTRTKILNLSASVNGYRHAFLTTNAIHVFDIQLKGMNMPATNHYQFRLPSEDALNKILVAGPFIVAWGFSPNVKQSENIHLRRLDLADPINIPEDFDCEELVSVALAAPGIVGLVCRTRVVVFHITAGSTLDLSQEQVLYAPANYSYYYATFSTKGIYLYTIASGPAGSPDCFTVWTHDYGQYVKNYVGYYEMGADPQNNRALMAYNFDRGCILKSNANTVFPAQFPRQRNGKPTILRRLDVSVSEPFVVGMFGNTSLLTVETIEGKLWLREFLIRLRDRQQVDQEGKQIHELTSKVDRNSQLTVIESRSTILVVVTNMDGSVEIVTFELQNEQPGTCVS